MKKSVVILPLICLATLAIALPARAEDTLMPPPLPPQPALSPLGQEPRIQLTPEQLEQWRIERRTRREAWQQMSPEERHQLRRDIRDAGHELYPRVRRGHDPRKD
jgi:hypothetical protein